MKTGDDVVSPITIKWNSKTGALTLNSGDKKDVAVTMNKWHTIRIECRIGSGGTIVTTTYFDGTYLDYNSWSMNKIGGAGAVLQGFRLKNKNVTSINGGEMYFADTTISPYYVD